MLSKLPVFTIALAAMTSASAQSILAGKEKAPATVAVPVVPAKAAGVPPLVISGGSSADSKVAAAAKAAVVKAAAVKAQQPAPAVPTVAAQRTKAVLLTAAGTPAAVITTNNKVPSPAPVAPIAPVVAAPRPQVVVLTAAGSAAAQSGTVTIAELAERQAQKLAAQAAQAVSPPAPVTAPVAQVRQVVPELIPVTAIPVLMDGAAKPKRAPKATPPKSYLASIIGMRGQEVVEIQTGDGTGHTLKVGDSIANWSIVRIVDGKLFLTSNEYSKKSGKTESRSRVLSVGDSL